MRFSNTLFHVSASPFFTFFSLFHCFTHPTSFEIQMVKLFMLGKIIYEKKGKCSLINFEGNCIRILHLNTCTHTPPLNKDQCIDHIVLLKSNGLSRRCVRFLSKTINKCIYQSILKISCSLNN